MNFTEAKYYSRQRHPLRVCWLLFLNLTLGCTDFANSADPENRTLLCEALSMLATKKNECSQRNCTSLSTLNKTFLSTFNFAPKINEFLSKIPPISHTFVKHDTGHIVSRNLYVLGKNVCLKFFEAQFTFENFLRYSCFSSGSLPLVYSTAKCSAV